MKTSTKTQSNTRIPIITILGHVDHGKTTILDKIRNANVQLKEVGGITQKISAFTIEHEHFGDSKNFSKLTFIDTPGHEAFDLMRKRGGDIADIVLLIVAADDGLKPQTLESIEIIKASRAKPIVVVNKVDLPNLDIEKIKRELANNEILVEGMGGDIPLVQVSGKTGKGIPELLDTIALLIDVEGIRNPDELPDRSTGRAFVLESVKDNSKGNVSTVIATGGELKVGDWLVYGLKGETYIEKLKGFMSETGEKIDSLKAGYGGKIIGVSNLLELGAVVLSSETNDKQLAKNIVTKDEEIRTEVEAEEETPDAWFAEMFGGEEEVDEPVQKLNIIVKSSSEGSLQAILKSLEKVDVDGFSVNVIDSGVGDVWMRDVEMARVTKSIILAFEVQVDNLAAAEARSSKILIRQYDIIYKLVDEVNDVLTAMSTPKETEEDLGDAEIKEIFVLSDGKKVLGGRVSNGLIKRGEKCYVVRGDDIVAEGRIVSLKHGKEDIKETQKGNDFGAIIEPTPANAEVGDKLFCFKIVK